MHHEFLDKKPHKTILVAVFAVFLTALTVFIIVSTQNKVKEGRYIGQEIESTHTITVSGTGEVYTKPDLALIEFSVVTEDKSVTQAMSANTEKMNDIIDDMKDLDIDEADLKTTSFSIYPRYEYRSADWPSNGRRVLVGYEVTQSLQVKVRNLAKIGSVIQGAADAGANQIGNLQFVVDDQDELKTEAQALAIADAKAQAQVIADQLDVNLTRITSFRESSSLPRYYESYLAKDAVGLGGEAPDIEPGENKIEVKVDITYEIH